MKQRITVEQLNELTEEQKEKLREWWEPADGDVFFRNGRVQVCDEGYYHDKENCYPLLSTGQMIELLLSHKEIDFMYDAGFSYIKDTDIELAWNGMNNGAELCDALWEAVKATL